MAELLRTGPDERTALATAGSSTVSVEESELALGKSMFLLFLTGWYWTAPKQLGCLPAWLQYASVHLGLLECAPAEGYMEHRSGRAF